MTKNNRIGKFKLSTDYLEKWEELIPLMGNFVPVKVECEFADRCLSITAYSPLFDEAPKWTTPPEYEIIININDFSPAEIIAKKLTGKGFTENKPS